MIKKLFLKRINDICVRRRILACNKRISKDIVIKNPKNVVIGKNCGIGENSYILSWDSYQQGLINQQLNGKIVIGDNFNATRGLTIQCCNCIEIGKDVLIASNVFICDYNHGINNLEGSYLDNELVINEVKIGDGVWIGQGAYIMPGVHIGNKAIIGAASVVTHDIDPYTIVAGNPARVIKKYDFEKKMWIAVRSIN